MSPNIKEPFGTFLRACFVEYKATLPEGKISERLWIEKVDEWHDAWHNFRKPKRKKRSGAMTDVEWVASLKVDPFLSGVDVDTEIAKCQFHFRNLAHPVIPSRKRIANWLKNADRTVAPKPKPVDLRYAPEPKGDWRSTALRIFKLDALPVTWKDWATVPPDYRLKIATDHKP